MAVPVSAALAAPEPTPPPSPASPRTAPAAADVGSVAPVEWGACDPGSVEQVPPEQLHLYSCASYPVPIDHDDPASGTVDLALMRRAAATPDARVGSLFLNPGGPGGSGLTLPATGETFFARPVLDRFDLIGFDPRGVGASAPLRCFTTAEEAAANLAKQVVMPVSEAEIESTLGAYREYGDYCARNAGPLIDHMSTKDVTRDLDLLRAAAGEEELNFAGLSYGTLIGATYANMFPERTRAMVLDGNVDPALRTGDGLRYDRERTDGFDIALDAYLAECTADAARCAFSDGDPRAKFEALRTHLRNQPITLPDGTTVDLSLFTGNTMSALNVPGLFPGLAEDLQVLYSLIDPAATATRAATGREALPTLLAARPHPRTDADPRTPYTADDSYLGVNCTDKPFGNTQDEIPAIAGEWETASPAFGRSQAFADPAGCPVWPNAEPDTYTGPWNAATPNPLLLVGNYYDPATPYVFSQRMAAQLGNARLVTADAHGHCVLGSSTPIDDLAAEYLITLAVPAQGQVFPTDARPFDPAPPA
ncbi:peptidase [Amycolatopsis antarctica]|uniref:Peptidase n=1 Tax=Amycolatopsis antarctica TaxID=1854586 RepID=A0A263D365_9PSEU|nr:peptidase [Amycolatopsis antarctica]